MKLRLLALGLALAALLPAAKAESFLEVVGGTSARTTTGATQIVGSGMNFTVGKLRLTLDPGQRAFISSPSKVRRRLRTTSSSAPVALR